MYKILTLRIRDMKNVLLTTDWWDTRRKPYDVIQRKMSSYSYGVCTNGNILIFIIDLKTKKKWHSTDIDFGVQGIDRVLLIVR